MTSTVITGQENGCNQAENNAAVVTTNGYKDEKENKYSVSVEDLKRKYGKPIETAANMKTRVYGTVSQPGTIKNDGMERGVVASGQKIEGGNSILTRGGSEEVLTKADLLSIEIRRVYGWAAVLEKLLIQTWPFKMTGRNEGTELPHKIAIPCLGFKNNRGMIRIILLGRGRGDEVENANSVVLPQAVAYACIPVQALSNLGSCGIIYLGMEYAVDTNLPPMAAEGRVRDEQLFSALHSRGFDVAWPRIEIQYRFGDELKPLKQHALPSQVPVRLSRNFELSIELSKIFVKMENDAKLIRIMTAKQNNEKHNNVESKAMSLDALAVIKQRKRIEELEEILNTERTHVHEKYRDFEHKILLLNHKIHNQKLLYEAGLRKNKPIPEKKCNSVQTDPPPSKKLHSSTEAVDNDKIQTPQICGPKIVKMDKLREIQTLNRTIEELQDHIKRDTHQHKIQLAKLEKQHQKALKDIGTSISHLHAHNEELLNENLKMKSVIKKISSRGFDSIGENHNSLGVDHIKRETSPQPIFVSEVYASSEFISNKEFNNSHDKYSGLLLNSQHTAPVTAKSNEQQIYQMPTPQNHFENMAHTYPAMFEHFSCGNLSENSTFSRRSVSEPTNIIHLDHMETTICHSDRNHPVICCQEVNNSTTNSQASLSRRFTHSRTGSRKEHPKPWLCGTKYDPAINDEKSITIKRQTRKYKLKPPQNTASSQKVMENLEMYQVQSITTNPSEKDRIEDNSGLMLPTSPVSTSDTKVLENNHKCILSQSKYTDEYPIIKFPDQSSTKTLQNLHITKLSTNSCGDYPTTNQLRGIQVRRYPFPPWTARHTRRCDGQLSYRTSYN